MEVAENQIWCDTDGYKLLVIRAVDADWFSLVGVNHCRFDPKMKASRENLQHFFEKYKFTYCGIAFNVNDIKNFDKFDAIINENKIESDK